MKREITEQPPPLGKSTPRAILDNIETNNGLLPISLRAFYEVVGSINFVGTPFVRPNWPSIEDGLDPLYVAGVEQSFGHVRFKSDPEDEECLATLVIDTGDGWVTPFASHIWVAPDYLHKYYIKPEGNVIVHGNVFVHLPAAGADVPLEAGFDDRIGVLGEVTFVRYLRCGMESGGFFTFMSGSGRDARPESDLAQLTKGLLPI